MPENYTPVYWPSWRYGPNGEAAIFEEHDVIPDGWADHPSKAGVYNLKPDLVVAEPEPDLVVAEPEPKRRGRPPKAASEEMQF